MPQPASLSRDEYLRLELRIGLVLAAEAFSHDPEQLRLWVDFGPGLGVRRALSPLATLYERTDMPGRLVVAALNLDEEPEHDFPRECRVLTVADRNGHHTLLEPDHDAEPGQRVF